jgi:hypothetical protein
MKKMTLFCILLIFLTLQSYSQKTKDVLYLKNGSMIYGTLMEISNDQYKLKGSDGSIFIYSSAEVDRYTKEVPSYAGRKKSGMTFALEAGLLVGGQVNDYRAPFSFNAIAGYTIEKKNMLGIGSGAEFLGQTFVPLFLEYRYTFKDKKFSPYLFMRSGLLIHAGNDENTYDTSYPQYYYAKNYRGGPSLNIGTGLSWAGEDVETYVSFSYRYARTSYDQAEYNQQDVSYTNNYHRLEVKFGFRF